MRTLAALPPAERQLLLRAFTLLWLYRLALWLAPFRVVMRWANRSRTSAHDKQAVPQLVQALWTASSFVPRTTCLVQALAGVHLFTEQGQRVRVVIGARKRAEMLEAHAWLESGGRVVLGNIEDLHSYHPLDRPEGR